MFIFLKQSILKKTQKFLPYFFLKKAKTQYFIKRRKISENLKKQDTNNQIKMHIKI
jgi:hypothetical protein